MSKAEAIVKEGVDWSADRYARAVRWARAGWALAAGLFVLLLVVVVLGMLVWVRVSKPVAPVVLAVDHATGDVQALPIFSPAVESRLELLQKFFVKQYVTLREGYLFDQLNSDYATVDGMSDGQAQKSYEAIYSGSDARHKVLQDTEHWVVHILSIELPPSAPGTAVVRFARTVVSGGGARTTAYYTARLSFTFHEPEHVMTEQQLITNPVGFTVTSYVADADLGQ